MPLRHPYSQTRSASLLLSWCHPLRLRTAVAKGLLAGLRLCGRRGRVVGPDRKLGRRGRVPLPLRADGGPTMGAVPVWRRARCLARRQSGTAGVPGGPVSAGPIVAEAAGLRRRHNGPWPMVSAIGIMRPRCGCPEGPVPLVPCGMSTGAPGRSQSGATVCRSEAPRLRNVVAEASAD